MSADRSPAPRRRAGRAAGRHRDFKTVASRRSSPRRRRRQDGAWRCRRWSTLTIIAVPCRPPRSAPPSSNPHLASGVAPTRRSATLRWPFRRPAASSATSRSTPIRRSLDIARTLAAADPGSADAKADLFFISRRVGLQRRRGQSRPGGALARRRSDRARSRSAMALRQPRPTWRLGWPPGTNRKRPDASATRVR